MKNNNIYFILLIVYIICIILSLYLIFTNQHSFLSYINLLINSMCIIVLIKLRKQL